VNLFIIIFSPCRKEILDRFGMMDQIPEDKITESFARGSFHQVPFWNNLAIMYGKEFPASISYSTAYKLLCGVFFNFVLKLSSFSFLSSFFTASPSAKVFLCGFNGKVAQFSHWMNLTYLAL
jgi:hypothetical protein